MFWRVLWLLTAAVSIPAAGEDVLEKANQDQRASVSAGRGFPDHSFSTQGPGNYSRNSCVARPISVVKIPNILDETEGVSYDQQQ